MSPTEKLLAFFRSEFQAEEGTGFARLQRVPDSRVEESLGYFQSLSPADQVAFVDCYAHFALAQYWFVAAIGDDTRTYLQGLPSVVQLYQEGLPDRLKSILADIYRTRFDHTKHPFLARWADVTARFPFRSDRNVPIVRAAVSQYKMDRKRGVTSCVSDGLFRRAEAVQSLKTAELRKRVQVILDRFAYERTDAYSGHRCFWEGQSFQVNIDFGARNAQLRYSVTPWEYQALHPLGSFCFEAALGMGFGHWNYIVRDNADDVFQLFDELIKYAVDLPRRMRAVLAA